MYAPRMALYVYLLSTISLLLLSRYKQPITLINLESHMKAPQLNGQHEVRTAITINTPVGAVWNALKEFGTVSEWAPTVSESHYLTAQTEGVGTGRHCHVVGFGNIEEHVTDWFEGKGFAYTVSALGPFSQSNSSWWLTRIDDQTTKLEVVFSYNIRFGIFGKILHKLVMRKKLEQSLPETVAATKNHVENNYRPAAKQVPLTTVAA